MIFESAENAHYGNLPPDAAQPGPADTQGRAAE
jgi:hypothetical protein